MISRVRSSASRREAMYTVETGMPARRASTTELRPETISWVDERLPPRLPLALRDAPAEGRPEPATLVLFASAPGFLYALWYGRSSALGVGPLPSSALRPLPPVPAWAPFFVPALRVAPRRWELPAMR